MNVEIDLIKRPFRRMGAKERQEFAKMKCAEEEAQTLEDPRKVKTMAKKFEQEIKRQRKLAGLA